ncbi:large conductance mechanosensitive channel protein MscL [Novosphingobium sp. FSY-8]|uniref:Large-conductance mechanosensitive channel n=1 Tax=Novosphingobium ovatum TaxID=1908523 RepID=A0ABW9XAN6_9SPHN|nr:large conductance mechanosensitive channel protein MscL [Novosphingobium ovatum]NBC35600.1 large conductance mechanosensitive channel protein MscL [Novosphingobium ovatum]
MLQEFKTFIARGNVLDLAVGVIIGGAFGKIVASLTDDVLMPIIGKVTGGIDFSSKFVLLGDVPASYTGSLTDYAALKKAGVAMLGYGSFITAVINFLIMAFVIFLIVKAANKATEKPAAPEAPAAPAGPSEIDLLTEIRDALKK